MVGAAGVLPPLDMTFLWNKELKFEGTVFYGNEDYKKEKRRTFDVVLDLLSDSHDGLAELVTHRFPLEDYARAIDVNLDRREHKSVKAVFKI